MLVSQQIMYSSMLEVLQLLPHKHRNFPERGFHKKLQNIRKLLLQMDYIQNNISCKKTVYSKVFISWVYHFNLAIYRAVFNRDRYDYLIC